MVKSCSSTNKIIFYLPAMNWIIITISTSLNPHIFIFIWKQLSCMLLVRFKSEVSFSNVSNSFAVNLNVSWNFSHGHSEISLHCTNYLSVSFRSVYNRFSSFIWSGVVTKSFYGYADCLFQNIKQMYYFTLLFLTIKKTDNRSMVVKPPVKEI